MNTEQFAAQVQQASLEEDLKVLDALALAWLREACKSNGRAGRVGLQLLEIVETECLP